METNNPENFFETDTQQAKRLERAKKEENKFGDPVSISSKILAVITDPRRPHASVFVAESAGKVSQVDIESRTITARFKGPIAPVTCLATGGPNNSTLFAGSWDKTVWSWDIATRKPCRRYDGHSDFVKAIVAGRIGDRHILVTGSADKKIMVWDIESGRRLYVLQDPNAAMMSLQSLAIDPVLSTEDSLVLVSGSSDPSVRRWRLKSDAGELVTEESAEAGGPERAAIEEHETSVYKVLFDLTGDEVDLWTASADGTAKSLSRGKKFTTEDTFEHGDFVKGLALTDSYVATGGFSQDVKIWDRTSGKLLYTLSGHFDEITDFAVLRDPRGKGSNVLCSVSIDGTLRTWPLDVKGLDAVAEEIRKANEGGDDAQKSNKDDGENLMTAEEEAELAALMDE